MILTLRESFPGFQLEVKGTSAPKVNIQALQEGFSTFSTLWEEDDCFTPRIQGFPLGQLGPFPQRFLFSLSGSINPDYLQKNHRQKEGHDRVLLPSHPAAPAPNITSARSNMCLKQFPSCSLSLTSNQNITFIFTLLQQEPVNHPDSET
ncbi:hypothetical protein CRENBAI_004016 [Crenichthys baileyi]|uniref:Uncharacterized protein n=1 Tax=Crenichthys baileyi TaxID=28760 RepID=A0AAV9R3C9_9TELE